MNGKLVFVPDTHMVVPKEPTNGMYKALDEYGFKEAIEAAPQLTTPPVLRWEGDYLMVGNTRMAFADEFRGEFGWSCQRDEGYASSLEEARRAAEKALGLPIIHEA